MKEFKLPPDAQFPLEVETVGGLRAWIDSDKGRGKCPYLGRFLRNSDITQSVTVWTKDGSNADTEVLDLKPIFTPEFPDFIPAGWWISGHFYEGILIVQATSKKPRDSVDSDGVPFWALRGDPLFNLRHTTWDWSRTFHPDWTWEQCCLQVPEVGP